VREGVDRGKSLQGGSRIRIKALRLFARLWRCPARVCPELWFPEHRRADRANFPTEVLWRDGSGESVAGIGAAQDGEERAEVADGAGHGADYAEPGEGAFTGREVAGGGDAAGGGLESADSAEVGGNADRAAAVAPDPCDGAA